MTQHLASRLATVATLSGLAASLSAQAFPLHLESPIARYQAGERLVIDISGVPGTNAVLVADVAPGPTTIPGIGTFQIGFTPVFGVQILPPLPASGFQIVCNTPCVPSGSELVIYTQALSVSATAPQFAISNPLALRIADPAGFCAPPLCAGADSIGSNFNGTDIAAGRHIWFNAVGKLRDLNGPGTIRVRNARVQFAANGAPQVVNLPDTTIIVSPLFTTPSMFYDPQGEWRVLVPEGFSGNVFLGGGAYEVPAAGLPGGINPVTWSFDVTSNGGASVQWKWAAAVYRQFTWDYNALGVAPADASGIHAGVPTAFGEYVVGGARGGGGSNFTGSYSGTSTVVCR